MPASRTTQSKTALPHSHASRAPPSRGTSSFMYPEHANRAIWPAAILAAIAAEERTPYSSVEGLPENPNAWDWGKFFAELTRSVGGVGLGELLDEQVLDDFLRKFPHAIEMTAGMTLDRWVAFQGGPPPPAPTASTFDRAQTRLPDPHGSFRSEPPPPVPTTSSFNHSPHPSTHRTSSRGLPPHAPEPYTMSSPSSPSRRSRPLEPFVFGPPPLAPTTASFPSTSIPYPSRSSPRHLPLGVLRRAALRATGQALF